MCGICGIVNFNGNPVKKATLAAMTDTMRHRGPDGAGLWHQDNIGFGHRRLAIFDLSERASQPMSTEDQRYTLVYNGAVYNFRQLRKELTDLGYRFISTSDTEVILAAWTLWGPGCVERFNGMFAFALWDRRLKTLHLARDRYGIKPLYYGIFGDTFLFASEQKAILAHPDVKQELDLEALVEYFTFQNIFSDRTLNKNIHLFPAGTRVTLKLDGDPLPSTLNFQKYWEFNFQEPAENCKEEEYVEELDRLFCRAVKRQLVSDVPIGSYLSGGIDSGSVSCVAAGEIPGLPTFTCGFDLHSATGLELAFDERERAEHMSYLFGTEHYQVVLKAGDMERVLPKLAWHLEEPRAGQCYPNYYISQLASKFVKVVLSGTGGDELFGGYPWRYYRGAGCPCIDSFLDAYYSFWQRLVPETEHKDFFAPIWSQVSHVSPNQIFKGIVNGWAPPSCTPEHFINLSLNFEAKTFLHGLLIVEDKLAMAHGLETRVPFLDNDLVDFAMNLPVHMKVKNLKETLRINENEPGPKNLKYYQRTGDGKSLLRKVLTRYVPPIVTTAAKQGFSAPDASWFRGESIDYIRTKFLTNRAAIYDLLDRSTVQRMVSEHLTGKKNRRLLIWSLLNVEQLLQKA